MKIFLLFLFVCFSQAKPIEDNYYTGSPLRDSFVRHQAPESYELGFEEGYERGYVEGLMRERKHWSIILRGLNERLLECKKGGVK